MTCTVLPIRSAAGLLLALLGALLAPSDVRAASDDPARCHPVAEPAPAGAVEVCALPLPSGGVQRLWIGSPGRPKATLVLFPGGAGQLGLGDDGRFRHGANILLRTRNDWLARGFAVVIGDAPTAASLRGRRSTEAFGRDAAALLGWARARFAVPVFAIGTSQGTIAAVNAAATAPDAVAGVVLLESLSRLGGSGETVFDAQPARVTAPVLVVANAADACPVTPPADADRVAAAFTSAKAEGLRLDGPPTTGEPCASLSAHGYRGIEDELVAKVAAWLDARRDARRAAP